VAQLARQRPGRTAAPRPQPGPGPAILSAAWAYFGPTRRLSISAVDSNRAAQRHFREIKSPGRLPFAQTLTHFPFPPSHSLSPAEHRGTQRRPPWRTRREERWHRPAPSRRRECSPEAEHTTVEGPRGGALLPRVRGRDEISPRGGHPTRRRYSSFPHNEVVPAWRGTQVGPTILQPFVRVRVSL
jgi:hypothetical protein